MRAKGFTTTKISHTTIRNVQIGPFERTFSFLNRKDKGMFRDETQKVPEIRKKPTAAEIEAKHHHEMLSYCLHQKNPEPAIQQPFAKITGNYIPPKTPNRYDDASIRELLDNMQNYLDQETKPKEDPAIIEAIQKRGALNQKALAKQLIEEAEQSMTELFEEMTDTEIAEAILGDRNHLGMSDDGFVDFVSLTRNQSFRAM